MQHDYSIDNDSGAAVRADINDAFEAAVTRNSGTSGPSTTYANMTWPDTTNHVEKVRNEANTAWIIRGRTDAEGVLAKAANYTLALRDFGKLIDATSATWTLTLPAAATATDGFWFMLRNTGSGVVTVDGSGAETIDGAASRAFAQGESAIIVCNGTLWRTVGYNSSSSAISAVSITPGGRLTLTTATPVTVSDVTAAGTIYYALYHSDYVPLWNGSAWVLKEITELPLALDSDSGHTGYHQSGKNFDVFIDYNGGTPRLVTGPAWTSDTTRADAISRKDGRWTNNGSMTVRFGTGVGDTASMAANTGLYVGTIRASANGQTEDSKAKRFIWNMYHRARRGMYVADQTDSWTYTSATIRQANGAAANQISFLRGLDEDAVEAFAKATVISSSGSARPQIYVGLDATNAQATDSFASRGFHNDIGGRNQLHAVYRGFPGLGFHYLTWLEADPATSGTDTWYGDDGQTRNINGIHGELLA